MPRLPDKTALGEAPMQGHRPDAMIPIPKDGFQSGDGLVANEIAKGVGRLSGIVEAKQIEADDYEVQKSLVEFDLEQEKRLDDAKRSAAPEAKGFTEGYRGGYDSAATDLMRRVPDRLKPKVDEALVKRGASFEKRAYDFELAERDRWNVQDVEKQSSDLVTRSMTSPDSMEDNAQRGVAVIRASRLTARAKVDMERKFLDDNAYRGISALIDREVGAGRDPGPIVERLRRTPRSLVEADRTYRADEALPPERVGSVSAKYESGGRGVGMVSSGKGDPGGVSYGAHQLSTKDSMPAFLRSEEGAAYSGKFDGLKVGSPEFNRVYKEVAASDPEGLASAQYSYYARTHYQPLLDHAKAKGLNVEDRGVQEALFSMAVQHGGAKKIVDDAVGNASGKDPASQIKALYSARYSYVDDLRTLPGGTKTSVLNRYDNEIKDALALVGSSGGAVGKHSRTSGSATFLDGGDGAGVVPVDRATLPEIDGVAPKQDTSGVKTDPETGKATLSKDIGDTQSDIPGEPNPGETTSSPDDLVEHDQPEWAYMSPATRRKLINYARTSYRAVATQAVDDDISRIRLGRSPRVGEDGRTSIERAKSSMTNMQFQKKQQEWREAEAEAGAIAPLRSMTQEQAADHVASITSQAEDNEESFRAAARAAKKAEVQLGKITAMRDKDPVRSVNGIDGDDPGDIRQPLANTLAAERAIRAARQPAVQVGPNGERIAVGPPKAAMTPHQEWEMRFEARLADQVDVMPDEVEKHRIITRREGEQLLRMPKDGKGLESNARAYREKLEAAGARALEQFGPKYAKRALSEAMGFQLSDAGNAHVRKKVAEAIAFQEPLIASDLRQAQKLDDLNRAGLSYGIDAMVNMDRVGRDGAVDPSGAVGVAGISGRPAIGQGMSQLSQKHVDWLRSNPDGWQAFDDKFGQGAASRALVGAGDDPWGDKGKDRKELKKKENPSTFEKPKPGWFGR